VTPNGERIAIVGLGGLFPGAANFDQFWENLANGIDSSTEVPAGRWCLPPDRVFDPRPGQLDRVYSTRGYYLDQFEADLSGLDIDPSLLGELDVLFSLALHAGGQAFRSAMMAPIDRRRIGVILGSIALPTDRISELAREIIEGGEVRTHPLNRHVTGLPAILLARALGLGGIAFTLDAACASSLYAVKLASDELLAGRADAMLAGGLSRPDCLYTQMGFSQLRALSLSGRCAPFDSAADGLVVGEGAGIFVLKRLSDALKHGDQIHGVIAGIGLSNDVEGNLLAPASEGQLRAMRSAYRQSGWRPGDVDLIECHATGTPLGDRVEFESLLALWREEKGSAGQCAIGSVKASVGHLLTGAGAAGLMKVILAMRHETLPPTANFHEPAAGIGLEISPFGILEQAEPWKLRRRSEPRRAAVSGFGFGGVNAHLLIEEWTEARSSAVCFRPLVPETPLAVVGIGAHFGTAEKKDDFAEIVLGSATSEAKPSFIDQFEFPLAGYAIPPKELEELLPQQLLLLKVAEEALGASNRAAGERTGILIGLGLDLNTTNFHRRWQSGVETGPPLTSGRTMGALASIAASRVARAFKFGGPSFTISSAELSGLHALEVASGMLRRNEIDRALVGAVDLNADERAERLSRDARAGDGAVALVLKRLDDAKRDGDRIIAVMASADSPLYVESPDEGESSMVRPTETTIGNCGAATVLAAVARACLALDRRVLPDRTVDGIEAKAQYWLNDDERGYRSARIEFSGLMGTAASVSLREAPADFARELFSIPKRRSALFCLAGASMADLEICAQKLKQLLASKPNADVDALARHWWKRGRECRSGEVRAAFVASSRTDIEMAPQLFRKAGQGINFDDDSINSRTPVFAGSAKRQQKGKLAFVYPGSGNHFPEMGRELGLRFPHVLDRQQRENCRLRSQFAADEFWTSSWRTEPHPRTALFGQVAFGTLATDLLRSCGIEPDAVIGYSLGESAGLFGMRAWMDRDGMLRRLEESSLFTSDLAAPFNAARAQWGWGRERAIDWITGVVAASAERIRSAIRRDERAYLLIINSADESVVGGDRPDVEALVRRLGMPFWEVSGVTSAHCEVAEPVRDAYWRLHHLPVTLTPGVRYYSGACGKLYDLTSESAADSILAAVLNPIDFPRVIESAYADGVRTFVEIGPGASCCRMIDATLRDRPHLVSSLGTRTADAVESFIALLGQLFVNGWDLNLDQVYPPLEEISGAPAAAKTLRVHGHPVLSTMRDSSSSSHLTPPTLPSPRSGGREYYAPQPVFTGANGFGTVAEVLGTVAEAHKTFLRFTANTYDRMSETIALKTQLLTEWTHLEAMPSLVFPAPAGIPRSLTFEQCCEFAAGLAAKVLGQDFAEVDTYPTRVRLPDGPLMLVDRILKIEGEPQSLASGQVVTEHRVHEGRWYLDVGRIPTCIAVEAGQADLFLSGFLGIDFVTRGLAVYRLLDAAITFHRPLPCVGETIRYDIHIDQFFRQGETHLFRFRFEGTVNGEPLLTMTDGCAGFFTAAELALGKGIVQTELDRRPQLGKKPPDWQPPVPLRREALSADRVNALRAGDLGAAFGPEFAGLPLRMPTRLPGGMLHLIDRVTEIEPDGGRFGLGRIRAEADIHADDWFLTCHFVDDMVMPGTLMYECCLHTLRVLLMRLGWIGDEGEVACEPVPGVTSRLKCRGQVIPSTQVAAYEVVLKEIGFGPEPYVIADALMYADGKPIVEMTNMSLRMAGLNREMLDSLWHAGKSQKKPLFNHDRILAFAVGKPSEAFGEPYRVFDSERVIARLPGPPYQFLDRITRIDAEPWQMKAGGVIDAEYDVPPDAWYFAAQRASAMPFSVLLEVALQPCGWLAAFVGSALTSDVDMSFRNLGGAATQHLLIGPEIGTLTTTVKLTRVSHSGGMIIQHYDFAVRSQGRDVYTGDTYFGFFSKEALANQVGLREVGLLPEPKKPVWRGAYPREAPFPDAMLRMVDTISWFDGTGGLAGAGAIEGRIKVDPQAWFFKAHFFQDPVWPGSLGLESFLQLVRLIAHRRSESSASNFVAPALGVKHSWVYRGQVLPVDREATIQATVTSVDKGNRSMTADGLLSVDGRVIYQMRQFALQA
jgi:acyl transferase domain-containing protein/3-hydroxymyristoyl/3-hydroxydecanoyl-(acyl carrier protein) dehydratase